jgi:hypothetical protein
MVRSTEDEGDRVGTVLWPAGPASLCPARFFGGQVLSA